MTLDDFRTYQAALASSWNPKSERALIARSWRTVGEAVFTFGAEGKLRQSCSSILWEPSRMDISAQGKPLPSPVTGPRDGIGRRDRFAFVLRAHSQAGVGLFSLSFQLK